MNDPNTDLEKAIQNPTSVYETPEQVLKDARFNLSDKRRILKSWELDARELAVAEAENMGGGEPNMLTRVLVALTEIDDGRHEKAETGPKIPTTHGST